MSTQQSLLSELIIGSNGARKTLILIKENYQDRQNRKIQTKTREKYEKRKKIDFLCSLKIIKINVMKIMKLSKKI